MADAPTRLVPGSQVAEKLIDAHLLPGPGGANPGVLQARLDATGGAAFEGTQRHESAIVRSLIVGVDAALVRVPDVVDVLVAQPAFRHAAIDQPERHVVRSANI